MPLGPVLPGRIPDTFTVQSIERNLNTSARELANLQQQLATGQRFFFGSEDPAAALRTVQLQSLGERKTQATINTQTGLSLLGTADAALGDLGNILNSVKTLSLAAVGESSTPAERSQFVTELETLIDSALQVTNREFRGRKIFSGTQDNTAAFGRLQDGVAYFGDAASTAQFGDLGQIILSGVDPTRAFNDDVSVQTIDFNPNLTADTKLEDLNGGDGIRGDRLDIRTATRTATIDISGAETIGDVAILIDAEFAGDPVTTTTTVTATGLEIAATAGNVRVFNTDGHKTATDLSLLGPGANPQVGGDLNPNITKTTLLTDVFAGVGIPNLVENFQITIGDRTEVVDFAGADTIEDFINAIKATELQIDARITDDGRGVEIISRVAGQNFAIGENNGTLATDLGLRTFTGATRLSELDDGAGLPLFPGADPGTTVRDLNITRRDSTEITIDLSAAETIQDVLDAINAVDPLVLTATLTTTGNGIEIQDTIGTDPLIVATDVVSEILGIAGEATAPADVITGTATNDLKSEGFFGLIVQLRDAIDADELHHINRIGQALDDEISRFASVRGDVGNRLKTLDQTQQRIGDEQLRIAEQLSNTFDADITETITRLASVQASYQATLQVSNRILQLNLLDLL